MKCKYCNYEMLNGANFCENCGAKVVPINISKPGQTNIPANSGIGVHEVSNPENNYKNNDIKEGYIQYTGDVVNNSGYEYGNNNNNYGNNGGYGYNNNNYGNNGGYGYGNKGGYGYNNGNYGYNNYNSMPYDPKYVTFGEAVKLYFKNYANFYGRSTRSEFWYAMLFNFLMLFAIFFVVGIFATVGMEILASLFAIVLMAYIVGCMVPTIAVMVRRLHDSGKSGWLSLVFFIPTVGFFILLAMLCSSSKNP